MTKHARRRAEKALSSARGTRGLAHDVALCTSGLARLRWEGLHADAVRLAEEMAQALADFPVSNPSQSPERM